MSSTTIASSQGNDESISLFSSQGDIVSCPESPLTSTQKCSTSSACRDDADSAVGESHIDVMKAYQLIRDGNISHINGGCDDNTTQENIEKGNYGGLCEDSVTSVVDVNTKLSKRAKVAPKLSLRSVPQVNKDNENASCSKAQCGDVASIESSTALDSQQADNDSAVDTRLLCDTEEGANLLLIGDVVDVIATTSENTDRRETKQVRFTSEDEPGDSIVIGTNNNVAAKIDVGASSNSSRISTNSPSKSGGKSKIKTKCRRGSQSESQDDESDGEPLGKQLESKGKVFAPNLGKKRRERLSSFSAYSSADEDDWQTATKKKKKENKKGSKKGEKVSTSFNTASNRGLKPQTYILT